MDRSTEYMMIHFSTILFIDVCRVPIDGIHRWRESRVANDSNRPNRLRRQQGGGRVMF